MRIIELNWKCVECETRNLGRHATCQTCGAPRETGETLPMGSTVDGSAAPTVTDASLLKLALCKPDWFCTHCMSSNRDGKNHCTSCNAPRSESDRDMETATESTIRPDLTEETEEQEIPVSEFTPVYTPPPEKSKPAWVIAGMMAILALAFGWWAMSSKTVEGSILSTNWEQTVKVERWTNVVQDGWYHKTTLRPTLNPVNGQGEQAGIALVIGSCHQKKFDDEKYVCGSHEVCHDVMRSVPTTTACTKTESYVCGETCSANGNGFATCHPKHCSHAVPSTCQSTKQVFDHKDCHNEDEYCTRPIYKDWCSYTTQDWVKVDTQTLLGSDFNPIWPNPAVGVLDRTRKSGSYHVNFQYTIGPNAYTTEVTPESEGAYRAWSGHRAYITRRNLGVVSSVTPL